MSSSKAMKRTSPGKKPCRPQGQSSETSGFQGVGGKRNKATTGRNGGAVMIPVLFARKDSIYKTLPYCDVYDIDRDALTWPGGTPCVAHPPCRAWGGLSHMAKPRDGEKELAIWAVKKIRESGGVLEHPKRSSLWGYLDLPRPGKKPDEFGGHSILVNQHWWGHRAEKATLLYIVGCRPKNIPLLPLTITEPTGCVDRKRRGDGSWYGNGKKIISKKEREATPLAFAEWLCEIARRCAS